jgi:chromosome partitioning protein
MPSQKRGKIKQIHGVGDTSYRVCAAYGHCGGTQIVGLFGQGKLLDAAHVNHLPQTGAAVGSSTSKSAHIIVFANEKGCVGKSTSAFHTSVALCNAGETVAAIDLDFRQRSFGRAIENRKETSKRLNIYFPNPKELFLELHTEAALREEVRCLRQHCSFLIIDVAGHDSAIARCAISMAHTLVTPVNDSFLDIEGLGLVDPTDFRFKTLGPFARLVQNLSTSRLTTSENGLDWIVLQNRLRRLGTKNERRFEYALHQISEAAGFRLAPGLGERVIYRELFPYGLTLLDLHLIPEMARAQPVAQAEISAMLTALQLPTTAAW